MTDAFGRTIDYLRLSVTELCNLRCAYCMPPEGICKRAHSEICSLEELAELAAAFVALGVRKIRLTGGEPLVRRGIVRLVERLAALKAAGLEELTTTTNGTLLPELAAPLRAAGLDRLNVSLDSLRPERYRALTRGGELDRVLAGIAAAEAAGFERIRLNAVLLKGVNGDELAELARLARDHPWDIRFIELMPIGPAAALDGAFLPAAAVLEAVPELVACSVGRRPLTPPPLPGSGAIACGNGGSDEGIAPYDGGVARYYSAPGWAGRVGLIAPLSACFCEGCTRVRLTADGKLKPCLHSPEEFPLRGLRGEALRAAILEAVRQKPARHRLSPSRPSDSARPMNEIGG